MIGKSFQKNLFMTTRERIIHSILFEVFALCTLLPFGALLGGIDMTSMVNLALGLALTSMCWNFIYNLLFDKYFGHNKIDRSLVLRISHAILFELGLLGVTLPAIMWALDMSFINALIMDIGLIIFFLIFAVIFNWCYDHIKHQMVNFKKSRLDNQC